MLMLQRADHSNFVAVHRYQQNSDNPDNICSLSPYGEELEDAYLFACQNEITSMDNIEDANMYGQIKRKELAKMISIYAQRIL